jgi:hypothetical protein
MITYDEKSDKWYRTRYTLASHIVVEELTEFEEIMLAHLWREQHPNLRVFEHALDQDTSDLDGDLLDEVITSGSYIKVKREITKGEQSFTILERVHSHISKHPPKAEGDVGDLAMDHYLRYWGYTTHPAIFFTDQEIESALQRLPGQRE